MNGVVATGKLRVFYDGACPVCSREVGVYRKRDAAGRIEWVDIAAAGFDARGYGLDERRVREVMHARTADGRVVTEVGAFVEIWRALPGSWWTGFLLGILRVPGVMWAAGVCYRGFARNRHRLTRRCAESCEVGRSD
ncbi:MAG TPA: DUF393 domain-containing protein [Phycisphaerae bacterium]|nr:DUF393 domain-containing protein [Phycisphaerae bacterium]